jgi:hypothetical protein
MTQRRIAAAFQIKVGATERRGKQEVSQRALACGLARPFLGRGNNGAWFSVSCDDLRTGLRAID